MNLATYSYIAELLKFIAVPFAIFELVDRTRRERIERAVIATVKYNARLFPILLVCTLVGFFLLALGAPYLFPGFVIIYFVAWAISIAMGQLSFIMVKLVSEFAVFVVFIAALIVWPLPDTWLVNMVTPVSGILDFIRSLHDGAATYIPQFVPSQYIDAYRSSANEFETWISGIWRGFRWAIILYIWASDGLMLLALLLLELSLFIFLISVVMSCVAIPFALFVKLSEMLKRNFDSSEKGILPLGGLAVWAIGELLNISINTFKFFWMPPQT